MSKSLLIYLLFLKNTKVLLRHSVENENIKQIIALSSKRKWMFLHSLCTSALNYCLRAVLCMCDNGVNRKLCAQSCLTLCDPMDYSPPGSSVDGIFQAKILEWLTLPSPGDLPDPGVELESLWSPALTGRFFTTRATWEAPVEV